MIGKAWVMYKNMDKGKKSIKNPLHKLKSIISYMNV